MENNDSTKINELTKEVSDILTKFDSIMNIDTLKSNKSITSHMDDSLSIKFGDFLKSSSLKDKDVNKESLIKV